MLKEFVVTREYIRRYVVLPDNELDIVTVWAIGTWTFSPACTQPAGYPYLYITAPKGSGKTVLGQDVLGGICRNHQSTVGMTGAGVFRMIGEYNPETGDIVSTAPTLALDEIDATFSGQKDEQLRMMLNAGYKRGATVPRVQGKATINFPVYCPKLLMGIDNGHLPDTITDRSIRIDMKRATPTDVREDWYFFDVEEESAEISAMLAQWAKDYSNVLKEYRPSKIDGLSPRQWEIARSLVQLAAAMGLEDRLRTALHSVMTANPQRPDGKVSLYRAIRDMYLAGDVQTDRLTSRDILANLTAQGIQVPGGSQKGLAAVLSEDGIAPDYIRFPDSHPAIIEKGKNVHRGYYRHKFDGAFTRYIGEDENDE